jgi:hypothetical protein
MYTYRGDIKVNFGINKKYSSVDISLVALNYYGDLAPAPNSLSTDISFTKPGISIGYSTRVSPRSSLQANFLYGALKGSDYESADKNDPSNGKFRYQRNLSFRNRIQEFSLTYHVDYFENESSSLERAKWTPYALVGLAVFHHNPQARVPDEDLHGNPFPNAGELVSLRKLGTEGQYLGLNKTSANYGIKPYKLFQPALVFGTGVRIRLSDNVDASIEMSMRYTFTDYLDDVSQNYIDLGLFGNNELAKAMSYRTNDVAIPNYTYKSEYDGGTYSVLSGYGSEHPSNVRGQKKDRDIYTALSIRVSYIIERYTGHKGAKHR